MAWPPTLAELKVDLKIDASDTRDDERLTQTLAAAVSFVERVRPAFNYDALVNINTADLATLQTLPGVDATIAQSIIDGRPYAAVADVEVVVGETVFDGIEALVTVDPDPTDDLELGTLRLAGRWHVRRRSPDGLIQAAEFGASRIASFDSDIERLLGIGRFAGPVIA